MVREWADLLVHVCRQIWKVFISLCLAIALTSTLVGLIIFCLSGTMGDFWWSLIKDGEQTSVHAVAELMWFIQVFLGHLCSSGAEKSWMPTLERSGHLKYSSWQLFTFLAAEVSSRKKKKELLWNFRAFKQVFVACCILQKAGKSRERLWNVYLCSCKACSAMTTSRKNI